MVEQVTSETALKPLIQLEGIISGDLTLTLLGARRVLETLGNDVVFIAICE